MSKLNQEEYLDEIIKEFISILYRYLPEKMIYSYGYAGSSFNARLSKQNKSYSDSQYFYKENKNFIHWTSIQNLMSIINYQEVRLYNLHNSSDSDEFYYAAEHLKLPEKSIEHAKKYLYTFSFCKSSELNNSNLWKEYGDNYKGVAIEFEIVNDSNKWNNFMLAPIFYKVPENLKKMVNELEEFKLRYPSASTHIDLGKLISFHKKPRFSKELEIRLSTYYPFQSTEEYEFYCNTEFRFDQNRARVTDYFGLKLWVNNDSAWIKSDNPKLNKTQKLDENYFIEKPKIKIKNIYFGKNCGIENQEFIRFQQKLQYITKIKLGYEIDLELNLYG